MLVRHAKPLEDNTKSLIWAKVNQIEQERIARQSNSEGERRRKEEWRRLADADIDRIIRGMVGYNNLTSETSSVGKHPSTEKMNQILRDVNLSIDEPLQETPPENKLVVHLDKK